MDEPFDPYYKWLGIPPQEQPPNHYRLLGLNLYEIDPDVISAAADRQMAHVRTYQSGPNADASQQILNKLAAARLCLLDPISRTTYNYELRATQSERLRSREPDDAFAQSLRGAVRYATLEAERQWLTFFRLPGAYLSLGSDVVNEGRFRDELCEQYCRLDEILHRYQALRPIPLQNSAEAASKRGIGSWRPPWLGDVARTIRLWFGTVAYHYRRRAVLRGIGRLAYSTHREASGPEHLVGRIEALQSALAETEDRLVKLSEVPQGQFLSPQRTAWLLAGLALLPILVLLWLL